MAFEARTFVTGEVVTAANMNTIRDSLLFLYAFTGGGYFLVKTADEGVASSATLQNDDHIVWAMGANTRWQYDGLLWVQCDEAAGIGIKIGWDLPASAQGFHYYDVMSNDIIPHPAEHLDETSKSLVFGSSSQTFNLVHVAGLIANGANAGNAQLQWAQTGSDSDDTVVLRSSFVHARQA